MKGSRFVLQLGIALATCLTSTPHPLWAAEPDNLLTGYSLTSWTHGDGVPLGTVYGMGQDRDGYLWIGADAGLLRFDGLRFTPWDAISDTPLPNSPVSALCVARDGTLWIGFGEGGGVRRLRDGRIDFDDHLHTPLTSVADLVEDRNGTMWAVSEGVLFRLRDRQWERISLPPDVRVPVVLHPYVDNKGELWVGTSRGLFRRVPATDSFERMQTGYTWGISEDAHGAVWLTDIAAGFRRLEETIPPPRPLTGAGYRLMHDRKGNLWVATLGEGLWRVRSGGKAAASLIERTALRAGLSSDSVQSLMEDRDGNVWVGTTGGLHRLTERKLTPIENVGFVVAVQPADDGGVLAGTTSGLLRLDAKPGSWLQHRQTSQPDVRSLHRDARGTVWVGTNEGLWRFAGGNLARVQLPPTYPQAPIVHITSDARGVWLGYGDWLFHWDGAKLSPFEAPPESNVSRITFANADAHGRLWIAHDSGQLALLTEGGQWRPMGAADGLAPPVHTAIYTIFEDSHSVVWVGGTGGLTRFMNGRFDTVSQANGLPGGRVTAIVDDTDGFLWLSVDRGLVRLSPEEFEKTVGSKSHRLQFRLYDTSDGLAGAPLGSIRSLRTSDGRLWIVRGGGLTMVDPNTLGDDGGLAPPPVRIESAVANESRFSTAPQTSLPPGTRRLQISYTALTLTASNKIRFRYRLDGFDTDWVDAGSRRQAFYTNLSPRTYRFRVEANTEDGTWNAATASWDFAIRPAFYQTSWFYASGIGAIALVLWGAWRIRFGIVRREFSLVLAERARLSREIHDTLLQSLVGVALQFDAISNTLDASSAAARNQLVKIRRQVEAYIREARQSIWDLRSPVLETHDLTAALRDFGRRAAAGKPVRFSTTVTGTPRPCPAKVENQLLRIGQEAITNAVRHSEAKRIQLEIRFDDASVALRVTDDGCGFEHLEPTHEAENHYGLTTMKERAEELGGRLKIATSVGQGTDVQAIVPLPKAS